jgi:RNA polymerase sigma factor CnrH
MLGARFIQALPLEITTTPSRPLLHPRRSVPVPRPAEAPDPTEPLTDGSLVALTLQGVEPAFTLLWKRHSRRTRSLVAARIPDAGDVADVMQETQLALWRALHRYDRERHFESWLTSIAINKCRDWARRRAVRRETLARFEDDPVHGVGRSWVRPAEAELIEDERLGALRRALAELPDSLRDPLLRTALDQHSQAVVARDLNITVKAVEMRVRRARQHLHSALAVT